MWVCHITRLMWVRTVKTYSVNGLRPLRLPCGAAGQCHAGRQGNALRGSRSMPCKQVLLALEFRRERRRLRAACAHDRCAPLLRHHNHRNRQHQRHNHDMSDDNGENDHIMIVIGERAIDLRCIWQVLDGRTKPCAVRSVMAGRSLAAVRSLDKAKPWMAGRSLARYAPWWQEGALQQAKALLLIP